MGNRDHPGEKTGSLEVVTFVSLVPEPIRDTQHLCVATEDPGDLTKQWHGPWYTHWGMKAPGVSQGPERPNLKCHASDPQVPPAPG